MEDIGADEGFFDGWGDLDLADRGFGEADGELFALTDRLSGIELEDEERVVGGDEGDPADDGFPDDRNDRQLRRGSAASSK